MTKFVDHVKHHHRSLAQPAWHASLIARPTAHDLPTPFIILNTHRACRALRILSGCVPGAREHGAAAPGAAGPIVKPSLS
jgi:hypothetical protein